MTLWRAKWNLLRLAIAAFLLWAIASDTGARLARLQLAALPDFDYAQEVAFLRATGRYGEALAIADAGLETLQGPARDTLLQERARAEKDQSSYLRRARDLGLGALSGQGTSLESLIGAVAADFFIVGDIRDLLIQGGRLVADGETDEVVLVLSGVGLATTLAPEVDWVPSLLKAARKSGSLSRRLGSHIVSLARAGKAQALMPLFRDVRRLAARASPGGALRILRHADTPEDLAKLAAYAERRGTLALHIAGPEAADLIKGTRRLPGLSADAAQEALALSARKGPRGIAWLRTAGPKALARPHLLVGIAKAVYKGNAGQLAARLAAALDPRAWWLIPLIAAWTFLESALLLRRARSRSASGAIPARLVA
jgi:hypothetical protein